MNKKEMMMFARSIVRDTQFLDAHFIRYLNMAYRDVARQYIIPRLNAGDPVELNAVSGSTQEYYLPYDFCSTIGFTDSSGRTLDVLPSSDRVQFNEYDALGSFVQFYEFASSNITPLLDSGSTPNTISITNRSTTVTCTASVFTEAHIGQWLLPLARNTTSGAGNPEDYAYLIDDTAGTTALPTATCTLARPFRGVLLDSGSVDNLSTGYFEVLPRNTPIVRIWGNNTQDSTAPTINCEYQRVPSKLANDEDVPEEQRLSEALVYMAIQMAGWAYREAFSVKAANQMISTTLSNFQTAKDFDKNLVRNYIVGNPNGRSYSQIAGMRMGHGYAFRGNNIRY